MTVWHAMRRRAAWVLAAFLIAQVNGVVTLLSLHASEMLVHASSDVDHADEADQRDQRGDHGHAGGLNGDCCTLHHLLAGILAPAFGTAAVEFASLPMISRATVPAESASPNLPDRPPKILRSI